MLGPEGLGQATGLSSLMHIENERYAKGMHEYFHPCLWPFLAWVGFSGVAILFQDAVHLTIFTTLVANEISL